ncbi:hypothetical protein AURDEDRAFT_117775 [Auricularia subglabra TFB-10046 SS5]|uniref:Zn(2)-C6 fungal-type domain-containing protein n=1 Tax=Auricularia subglabra (strain TFB-10046 / SS5) TaxID=717982 RepID=J0LC77_AURST|nr:hypothetical protein AURDEDRAFT_117775 [Auricularia subglabra TFB-10046 SS5]
MPPPTLPESPAPASPSRPTSRSSSLSRSPSPHSRPPTPVPTTPYPDTESPEDSNATEFLLAFFKPKTALLCDRAGQHLDPGVRFDDLLRELAVTALLRAEDKFPEQIAPLLVAATHANTAPTDPEVVEEMKAALKIGEQSILQVLEDPVVIPKAIRRALDAAAAAAGEPQPSTATAPVQARPSTARSHPPSTTAREPQPAAAMASAQARPRTVAGGPQPPAATARAHPHPLATTVPAQARPTTVLSHPPSTTALSHPPSTTARLHPPAAAGEPLPPAAMAPAQARPTTALSHPPSTTERLHPPAAAGEPLPPAAMAPAQARPTTAHSQPPPATAHPWGTPTTAHPWGTPTVALAQAAPKPARVRAALGRASPISAQPGKECARCKQKGLPCQYDKNPRPIQPGAPRTPVACLECRRAKGKCTLSTAATSDSPSPPPQAGTKRVRDEQDSPSSPSGHEHAGSSRPPKHPRLAEPSAANGSLRNDQGVGSLSRAAFWDPSRSSRYADPIVLLSEWVEFVDSFAQELEAESRRRVW